MLSLLSLLKLITKVILDLIYNILVFLDKLFLFNENDVQSIAEIKRNTINIFKQYNQGKQYKSSYSIYENNIGTILDITNDQIIEKLVAGCKKNLKYRNAQFEKDENIINSSQNGQQLMASDYEEIVNKNNCLEVEEIITEEYRNERGNVIKKRKRNDSGGERNINNRLVVCYNMN